MNTADSSTGPVTPSASPGRAPAPNPVSNPVSNPDPTHDAKARKGYSEYGVAALLLALGIWAVVDALGLSDTATARGPVGPKTVPVVVGGLLIERVGWPISGAILFFGSSYALGSRHYIRNVLISVVMSVSSWYLFYAGLNIKLPAGLLNGIL
jgi:putative tricarboxylic transport membrane protein